MSTKEHEWVTRKEVILPNKRIKVKKIRKQEPDLEDLAVVIYLEAKRVVRERREQEARHKAERREDRHGK